MELRDLLNKHLWHLGSLDALVITVRHRGAPGDARRIVGAEVVSVEKNGIQLVSEHADEHAVFLPYHRFLQVETAENVLWRRL